MKAEIVQRKCEATLHAVLIGTDGRPKQDLGKIGYWHRNPMRRLWWHIQRRLRR